MGFDMPGCMDCRATNNFNWQLTWNEVLSGKAYFRELFGAHETQIGSGVCEDIHLVGLWLRCRKKNRGYGDRKEIRRFRRGESHAYKVMLRAV